MQVSAGKTFTPVPEGVHLAIPYRIVDCGTQKTEWKGQVKQARKVQIGWYFPNVLQEEGENAGKPFETSRRYTASLGEKAALRTALEAWRGKKFTKDELDKFDLKKLIGVPCQLQIVHEEKDGKLYANIAAIMAVPAGMPVPKLDRDPFVFSFDDFDAHKFSQLSEKMQESLASTPEYKKVAGGDYGNGGGDDDIPF